MDYTVLTAVVATSLTSLPIAFVLNKINLMKDHRFVFAAGVLCLAAAAIVPALVLRRRYRNVDWIMYVFGLFCWTGIVDLFIGLELNGFVSNFMGFYLLEGEPYLNTSHGMFINYWDGTVQYALQLSSIALFCLQASYREVGLYWCGSIINSMLVLLPGAVLGKSGVRWSYLLNVPYALLPVFIAFKFIKGRPLQARSYLRVPWETFLQIPYYAKNMSFLQAVLGANISCMETYLKKYEPYLTDPSAFPKAQMLVNMYYFVFYYVCAMDGLINPGHLWMSDWAIIHAGAAAQSQFVHMASSIHSRTPTELRAPVGGVAGGVFWGVNLLLLVVPQLFALRCWRDPDNCGRTYTTDIAQPIGQTTFRHSYRTPRKRE
ncbi:hypothetical protein C0Q70_20697 [Pomacea canaliculata]|uniref:EXPERA domain-containing protein n=1 Tax=Pomacea canaliculata TaxID=400727 RepID=A0A2T7NGA2_POMCA|nr:hypothetical protein C0Q70_20697 [Pomacea canaliculata]